LIEIRKNLSKQFMYIGLERGLGVKRYIYMNSKHMIRPVTI